MAESGSLILYWNNVEKDQQGPLLIVYLFEGSIERTYYSRRIVSGFGGFSGHIIDIDIKSGVYTEHITIIKAGRQ